MKKIFFLLFIVSLLVVNAKAQVTIGSQDAPTPGAVLELKSPLNNLGFLPPRVTLTRPSSPSPLTAHVEGMVVFNTRVSETDTLQAGLYYDSGKRWILLSTASSFTQSWFYMPSIVFDTSSTGIQLKKNLYQAFQEQFNTSNPGDLVINSTGAPEKVLANIPARGDLYYYVTAYDPNVFANISIDANGVMTYDIINQASDATFINIVFVEKPAK